MAPLLPPPIDGGAHAPQPKSLSFDVIILQVSCGHQHTVFLTC